MSEPDDLIVNAKCPSCEAEVQVKQILTWQGTPFYRMMTPDHDVCIGARYGGNLWRYTDLR